MSTHQLPAEFIGFWKNLVDSYQRAAARAAHRHLQYLWVSGCHVPGYPDVEKGAKRTADYPRGWSYCNLLTYQRSSAELAMLRLRAVKTN